jgi:hypothetical protein
MSFHHRSGGVMSATQAMMCCRHRSGGVMSVMLVKAEMSFHHRLGAVSQVMAKLVCLSFPEDLTNRHRVYLVDWNVLHHRATVKNLTRCLML